MNTAIYKSNINTDFRVHWYCPYCNKEKGMTDNQWREYLLTHKWGEDYFPYCNNRHRFLNALKGKGEE